MGERVQVSLHFMHIANSLVWRALTGQPPPTVPPTTREYSKARLPWFDYYDDSATAGSGRPVLNDLHSVAELGKLKGDVWNGLQPGQVREGAF